MYFPGLHIAQVTISQQKNLDARSGLKCKQPNQLNLLKTLQNILSYYLSMGFILKAFLVSFGMSPLYEYLSSSSAAKMKIFTSANFDLI